MDVLPVHIKISDISLIYLIKSQSQSIYIQTTNRHLHRKPPHHSPSLHPTPPNNTSHHPSIHPTLHHPTPPSITSPHITSTHHTSHHPTALHITSPHHTSYHITHPTSHHNTPSHPIQHHITPPSAPHCTWVLRTRGKNTEILYFVGKKYWNFLVCWKKYWNFILCWDWGLNSKRLEESYFVFA